MWKIAYNELFLYIRHLFCVFASKADKLEIHVCGALGLSSPCPQYPTDFHNFSAWGYIIVWHQFCGRSRDVATNFGETGQKLAFYDNILVIVVTSLERSQNESHVDHLSLHSCVCTKAENLDPQSYAPSTSSETTAYYWIVNWRWSSM